MKSIIRFFDKLEDKVRVRLSHYPLVYSFVGGVGIVLFWKGVWETAEEFPALFGLGSLLLGTLIMLMTGLFVSFFIGDSIILSGLKREKKLVEKTEAEVKSEKNTIDYVIMRLDGIERKLDERLG
jgi:hypothetical protein